MCGIAGIYEYGRREGDVTEALLARMRDTLRHRGPDGEGLHISADRRLGLGHRRLSIVDPPGGAQPMYGSNGECLVFNGEIYNYPALRESLSSQGVAFRTNCDTEVILHLYARHGEGCLRLLNGMFAFALWDPARERLLFARDRIGEKPFYWADVGGRFLFGSEIKAIVEHPAVAPEVNERAIAGYLTNLVSSSPETLYRGIYKLPTGTLGVCDRDGVRVRRYWDLFAPRKWTDRPAYEAAGTVRDLLDRSVHDRLMSDVPVGVLLSGGLDSTTLVAMLRERATGLATFSVGFPDHPALDERSEARRVAEHFETDHYEITVSEDDAIAFLPRLVHHQDEPLADPVCLPLHFVCELARAKGVPVVLAGEGADELFWGYPRYETIMRKQRLLRQILALPAPARELLPHLVSPDRRAQTRELLEGLARGRPLPMHMPLGLTRYHRERLLQEGDGSPSAGWAPSAGWDATDDENPLTRLAFDTQEYEFALRLPELLLMRIDRFSMANSVEARVPFLDPELVEFAYRLPLKHKLGPEQGKRVLRDAVAGLVPDWVLTRRKQGFGAPVTSWFEVRLGELFRRLLREEGLRRYFDTDALEAQLGGGGPRFSLWSVMNFALWHRYWIEGEPLDDMVDSMLDRPSA